MIEPEDRVASALQAILAEVEAKKIHLHHSPLGQPWIFLDVEGRPAGCFGLFESVVKHWLAAFVWDKGHGALRTQELDRILCVLAGRAMMTPVVRINDLELLRAIETEPIVAVVLEYMYAQKSARIESTMKKLWEDLRDFAKERGLCRIGRKQFPGGSNVLSYKLKELAAILAQLGITVEIVRSNGCKVTVRRLDDPEDEPSVESSTAKSGSSNDLPREDDRERRRAFLAQRKANHDSRLNGEGT